MSNRSLYNPAFFSARSGGSERSAAAVVPLILERCKVESAVDVGCGVGDWARVLAVHGVSDVVGVDGDYVPRDSLRIPHEWFVALDLEGNVDLGRRFDLAICLEVAEHLRADGGRRLVAMLTRLADTVVFSAAVPGQGGTGHVNEQWPKYWAGIFGEHGYLAADWIRPAIWDRLDVDWWYAQNMLMYVSEAALTRDPWLSSPEARVTTQPMSILHPRSCVRTPFIGLMSLQWTPGVRWWVRAGVAELSRRLTLGKMTDGGGHA
jgi:SAM-dependent methyltransferase